MNRLSKVISFALVTTMVLGSSFTSFATNGDTRSAIGQGGIEGHVDQKTYVVNLPTVSEESGQFDYIMDPQRLISQTGHAKYKYTSWPTEQNDTGVYFNQGYQTDILNPANALVMFGSTSMKTTITNESSDDIDVTIKVEASKASAATDIPLVKKNSIETATEASLYLGLGYDDNVETTVDTPIAVLKDAPAKTTVQVKGNPNNFATYWDPAALDGKGDYVYGLKAAGALTEWSSLDFYLEGAVTGDDIPAASTLTAPDITVTWSWEEHDPRPLVTFNTGEGLSVSTIEPVRVELGGKVTQPTTPKKVDFDHTYEFVEWIYEGEPFDFNTIIENDITLYAEWRITGDRVQNTDGVSAEIWTTQGNNYGDLLLKKDPVFDPSLEVGLVAVNNKLINLPNYELKESGTLVIKASAFDEADSYEVKAIIGGEVYRARFYAQP